MVLLQYDREVQYDFEKHIMIVDIRVEEKMLVIERTKGTAENFDYYNVMFEDFLGLRIYGTEMEFILKQGKIFLGFTFRYPLRLKDHKKFAGVILPLLPLTVPVTRDNDSPPTPEPFW